MYMEAIHQQMLRERKRRRERRKEGTRRNSKHTTEGEQWTLLT